MPYRESTVMDLGQLTTDEGIALAALARAVLRADGQVGDGERDQLQQISEELGAERLALLFDGASRAGTTEKDLRRLASAVERPSAREAIFGVLFDLAASDGLAPPEEGLLGWLADLWDLHPSDADLA